MDIKFYNLPAFILFLIVFLFFSCGNYNEKSNNDKSVELSEKESSDFQNGDIIFQSSKSSQSRAIQLATNSKYSHCGIIYIENGVKYVFEAINPVQKTKLNEWISRGEGGHFEVKRLKNADEIFTSENLRKMKTEGEKMASKNYDLAFGWSDEKIYCSELVWKIYKRGLGTELGETKKLESFNLDNQIVKAKLKERYGNNIPLNETVISPEDIYQS